MRRSQNFHPTFKIDSNTQRANEHLVESLVKEFSYIPTQQASDIFDLTCSIWRIKHTLRDSTDDSITNFKFYNLHLLYQQYLP